MHLLRDRDAIARRGRRRASTSGSRRPTSSSCPSPTATSPLSPRPGRRAAPGAPSLRLASLAQLRHPYSVDLYVERRRAPRALRARALLGGLDYWRYGVEQLADAARAAGFQLAVVPGDDRPDPRLDAASTLAVEDLRRLWGWFHEGGPENAGAVPRLDRRRASAARRRGASPSRSPAMRTVADGARRAARCRPPPARADRLLPRPC